MQCGNAVTIGRLHYFEGNIGMALGPPGGPLAHRHTGCKRDSQDRGCRLADGALRIRRPLIRHEAKGYAVGMSTTKTPQLLKPATAAQKLGVFLPAAPPEFQSNGITREQLNALLETPPEWVVELRLHGPHPRQIVAGKLGVSTSGLARAGVTEALTTLEIKELLADPPEWLVRERATQAAVREEQRTLRERKAAQAR
jgi:hypothetical protein